MQYVNIHSFIVKTCSAYNACCDLEGQLRSQMCSGRSSYWQKVQEFRLGQPETML